MSESNLQHNLESGDIVICIVEKIVGTTVFVKIQHYGKELEGSIVLSEIAPGRIRNLRDYVIPKKKIVCKVLRVSGNYIELSLRRVTPKEKKEMLEQENQEKSYTNILKTILAEKANLIIEDILKKNSVFDFIESSKKDPKELEKLIGKEKTQKILDIVNAQKKKKYIIKKNISMTSTQHNGLTLIKEILEKIKEAEIKYLAAGRYVLKTESENPKEAENLVRGITEILEKNCKEKQISFSIKEK